MRELTLYLLDSAETSEFCAWLTGKVHATVGGYVAPPGTRVTIAREDRIKPVLQRLDATVPAHRLYIALRHRKRSTS